MNPSKSRILDAAEQIILREGVMHLTLDAVAAEAEMSKGGLLYHFHGKDDLIRGMIGRLHEQYEAEVARVAAADPNPVGRKVRAMLRATFPSEPREDCLRMERVAAALLAAVATNPHLLEETHKYAAEMERELIDDGLDPVLAMVIHCAADGIWMSNLFGMNHPAGRLREQVIERLLEMSNGVPAPNRKAE
jgi:AcrR family transcriptional regulator